MIYKSKMRPVKWVLIYEWGQIWSKRRNCAGRMTGQIVCTGGPFYA